MTTIACFGDSITQGNNLDFPGDAWPALVARRLGIEVDNRGVGGSLLHNSGPASPPRLMVADAVAAAVASWQCVPPTVAVVLAGHNDVIEHTVDYAQPLAPTSLEQSKWAAVGVDSTLRAAGVQHVLWVTLCPRTPGTLTADHPDWPGIIQGRIVNFNAWLLAQFGVNVIDTRGRLGDIEALIRQHGQWVLDKLAAWQERAAPLTQEITDGTVIPLLGEPVSIAMTTLGRAQVAAGEMQQALSTYEKLTSRLPNSPLPLIAQADLQVAAKDLNAAENSLRKALTIKPDAVEAQQRLVALLLNNKRGDAAVGVARDIQKQRKDAAIGYILEGEALIAQGKKAEAVPLFEEAYKRDKSAQSVVRLYAARTGAGQAQEASRGVAEWVKANPKDLVVRTYLAERSLAEQKYDQAVQQYRQMLELAPKNPMLLNNLAWALGKLNDKSALEVALQALALAPNSPVVLDTYGSLLLDNGDGAKGVETLRKAVSLGPKLPQLRVNLARGLAKTGDKDGAQNAYVLRQGLRRETWVWWWRCVRYSTWC